MVLDLVHNNRFIGGPIFACNRRVSFMFRSWKTPQFPVLSRPREFHPRLYILSIGKNTFHSAKPNDRAGSVRAIVSHLDLGEGAVIADIGAGRGRDTWVFAKIFGETGLVFAEEIVESNVESLKTEAQKRDFSQVRSVLGRTDDPCLPSNSVDLVYTWQAEPAEELLKMR